MHLEANPFEQPAHLQRRQKSLQKFIGSKNPSAGARTPVSSHSQHKSKSRKNSKSKKRSRQSSVNKNSKDCNNTRVSEPCYVDDDDGEYDSQLHSEMNQYPENIQNTVNNL